jgi:hypothetical protein
MHEQKIVFTIRDKKDMNPKGGGAPFHLFP